MQSQPQRSIVRAFADRRCCREAMAVVALGLLVFGITAQAGAEDCPPPLSNASRLVLITADSMTAQTAQLQLFSRFENNSFWRPAGVVEPAVVGKAGLAWASAFRKYGNDGELEKVEGDKKTPAGIFRIGSSFGFERSELPGYIEIKAAETVCVEDPASKNYNQITKRSQIEPDIKADDMRRTPLYRVGLFVDYPGDRKTRSGSCIFIHIWPSSTTGTAGCVGLPEASVRKVQEFASLGAVVAVLPKTALARFSGCLPK